MTVARFRIPVHLKLLALCGLLLILTVLRTNATALDDSTAASPFYYVSPRPDSESAHPGTTIALRSARVSVPQLLNSAIFHVEGSESGIHHGHVVLATDGTTVIFKPDNPFAAGEAVEVTISLPRAEYYSFKFTVLDPLELTEIAEVGDPPPTETDPTHVRSQAVTQTRYVTAPPDLPEITVKRWPGELADGYLFVGLYDYDHVVVPGYSMILDNDGELVFYDQPLETPASIDFKKQANGLITYYVPGSGAASFFAMNERYQMVDHYKAVGYHIDLHDLQILDNGHVLLLARDGHIVDRSEILPGGSGTVRVQGCVVQELDRDKNVIFQWASWDHRDVMPVSDTNQSLDGSPIDYVHCNSVERDLDGNLLISSRHLDEVTKINRSTGEIMWRLGGKKNQFRFLNDYGFAYQHDARRLSNGLLTVYDNGNTHKPKHSRGVVYRVDESQMTVEKVAEYRNSPDTYALSMGNYQALPNGNAMIGWGRSSNPFLTEFDSAGNKLLEFSTKYPVGSYRAFRFPWKGYPTWPPVLKAHLTGSQAQLHFSWNGSTETVAYKVFGGRDSANMTHLATVARDGFETRFTYTLDGYDTWYFWVIPVDIGGKELTPSNRASVNHFEFRTYLAAITAGKPFNGQ